VALTVVSPFVITIWDAVKNWANVFFVK
jgi:hypothetical protein